MPARPGPQQPPRRAAPTLIILALFALMALGVFAAVRLAQDPTSGWSAGWSGLVFSGAVATQLCVTLLRFWSQPTGVRRAEIAQMVSAPGAPTTSLSARRHLVMTALRDRPSWRLDTSSTATVVEVVDVGMTQENVERLYVELDVHLDHSTTRVATGERLSRRDIPRVVVGETVSVRFDGSDPVRISLDIADPLHIAE